MLGLEEFDGIAGWIIHYHGLRLSKPEDERGADFVHG
jgi:hypothetical protein